MKDPDLSPDAFRDTDRPACRVRSGWGWRLRRSPLTWRIVLFNVVALNVLAAGILALCAPRDQMLDRQRHAISHEASLIAALVGADMAEDRAPDLSDIGLDPGLTLLVITGEGNVLARKSGSEQGAGSPTEALRESRDLLGQLAPGHSGTLERDGPEGLFTALVPLPKAPGLAVAVSGTIDATQGALRGVLGVFLGATLVSILLSLVLASTIAGPLAELAAAVELGGGHGSNGKRPVAPGRVRIPDLSHRRDEIGRLSGALRGMVDALYDRIDSNEQFAADVAHEVKNPLASLRSAVGALRVAKRADQQAKLLEVIDHDVRRLDRLVSDISNASRLDSELVREEEEEFDLVDLVRRLCDHLEEQARAQGIELVADLQKAPVLLRGIEPRLAQVVVNLVTNAISFCATGDRIRVWVRQRANRVLIVVEDSGPGIPDEALTQIFTRFYSHRPESDFGNNSGLGLAISKQITEAHGGVIWAENIRPGEADPHSAPRGARFVVGLPI
ncbi:ATP-binding protein [Pseudooceanicola algae]|uniref:histidine kinase n=1 Tax=Pseudooceanicola algae TaxID=1537215 RepID=A0A418SKN8_9RHOB|nr:ATP-binding protein [Pseudooceanicola algae]QPM91011.1 Adaptive-response sensory-kinase SasA [Pseudooceanicola algae]